MKNAALVRGGLRPCHLLLGKLLDFPRVVQVVGEPSQKLDGTRDGPSWCDKVWPIVPQQPHEQEADE